MHLERTSCALNKVSSYGEPDQTPLIETCHVVHEEVGAKKEAAFGRDQDASRLDGRDDQAPKPHV